MEIKNRIVTIIPLPELWTNNNILTYKRIRYLKIEEIISIIKKGPIEFVIADVGLKLLWIEKSHCFNFWKNVVRDPIIESPDKIMLKARSDKFGYLASEWAIQNNDAVVLLEKIH